MTETEIQKEIVAYLKDANCLVYRMNAGSYTNKIKTVPKGTPDLLVITQYGFTFWIEVKTKTGKVTIIQGNMHSRLRSYGQRIIVARSVEDVQKYIK